MEHVRLGRTGLTVSRLCRFSSFLTHLLKLESSTHIKGKERSTAQSGDESPHYKVKGKRLLAERLKGKIDTDQDTSRRLFTLITALHWKG